MPTPDQAGFQSPPSSPDAAYKIDGFDGAIATAPIVRGGCHSMRGPHEGPPLLVRQTPPPAAPAIRILPLLGWMAIWLTRPMPRNVESGTGPMERQRKHHGKTSHHHLINGGLNKA